MSKKLYKVNSGLGGAFTVKILETKGDKVKVQPVNPGWGKHIYWIKKSELR